MIADGLTKARMLEIEGASVVSGFVSASGKLLLKTHNDTEIDAGNVVGPRGPEGPLTTGIINMFAGAAAPSGWMICDGSPISRTDYAALFAVIGTMYGAGDNSTTFNLPNLKGRVPVGFDSTQTEFNAIGKTGGEKTHLLTTAEMPAHSHTQNAHGHSITDPGHNHSQNAHGHGVSDPGHAHSVYDPGHGHGVSDPGHSHTGFRVNGTRVNWSNNVKAGTSSATFAPNGNDSDAVINGAGTGISINGSGTGIGIYSSTTGLSVNSSTPTNNSSGTGVTVNSTTATNNSTGGGGEHNNLQPFIAMNYIIRT